MTPCHGHTVRGQESSPSVRPSTLRTGPVLPGILLCAAIVWCSFRGGGYFPGTPAVLAVGACLLLMLRVTLAPRPLAGVSSGLMVAGLALALLAGWQLLSTTWSHAPGRAAIEADRTLLYLLVLLLAGLSARTESHMRWLVRGTVLAAVVVALAALGSRLTPDLVPTSAGYALDRLSYPLTYWNALGLLMVMGFILAFQLAADLQEPLTARVVGAAALPLLATTAFLTLSRGAIVGGLVGLVIYVILGRPRGLLPAFAAGAIPAGVAVVVAYGATELTTMSFAAPAGVRQGHHMALVTALCTLLAAILRLLLVVVDSRLLRIEVGVESRRRLRGATAVLGLVVLIVLLASGTPGAVGDRAKEFFDRPRVQAVAQARDRLTDPSANGRIDHWRVALDASDQAPLHGAGAGTFEAVWAQKRPTAFNVRDAHSLYLELLGELGWPGLVAVLVALGALVAGHLRRRREARALNSALLAVTLAWALHAAVDWDWEMPALTLPVFAAGGLNLAAGASQGRLAAFDPPRLARVVAGLACLLLALLPLAIARSQAPLREAITALRRADCPRAVDRALTSVSALGVRPEPYEVLGYCDARAGHAQLGVRLMRQAVKVDPHWWETSYGLALLQAAAGEDPRAAARAARAQNPRPARTRSLGRAMTSTSRPSEWRRRAFAARLPLR